MTPRAVTLVIGFSPGSLSDNVARVLDLAAGTGANLRYLSPMLGPAQEWLLVDIDPMLLAEASARAPNGVQVATRTMDLGTLDDPAIFRGRDLVTASALLDLVSGPWLLRVARGCRESGALALFALTYDGRSTCTPSDQDDEMIRELMNRHQRQSNKGFGRAAGPDATAAADAELLLPYGLCEARGPYLTNFGTAVRRALLDWMES